MSVSSTRPLLREVRNVTSLAALILTFTLAGGQAAPPEVAEYAEDELKAIYVICENNASSARMERGEVMFCSIIYEELKQRVFGGDFRKLKEWSEEVMELPGNSRAHRTDAKIPFGISAAARS